MISCSKCKKATLPVSNGGCIRTGGIVDIGCEYGQPRILTNYDLLISKSPEELAEMLGTDQHNGGCPNGGAISCQESCVSCWLDWLKQEATE